MVEAVVFDYIYEDFYKVEYKEYNEGVLGQCY